MTHDSHTLHTVTRALDDTQGTFRIIWRVGGRVGVVDVELRPDTPLSDGATAAELVAIQFLLSDKEVMGNKRTGKGLILDVSRGAVRKLRLGTSNKGDLTPYAVFLATRYHEAEIEVSKKATWIPFAVDGLEHDELTVSEPRYEIVDTPRLGRVAITQHAIEQYEERFSEGALSRSWTSLIKRLQNPELAPTVLPPRVLRHKVRTYGNEVATAWRHPDGTLHFVVLEDATGTRTLVTVFYRTDTEIDRSAQGSGTGASRA